MNGVCGLISLNGNIDLNEYAMLMTTALGKFKHHSTDYAIIDNTILAQVNNHAHILRGGEQHIRQTDAWLFAGHCRLDNRDNVLQRHNLSSNSHEYVSDTKLIEMYLAREDAPIFQDAFGDWVIAGWQKNKKHFSIAREHHGQNNLYYTLNNNVFAFSSALESLLALPTVKTEINERAIARSMTRWSGGDDFETCFKNIYFLPPASILEFKNNQIFIRKYWEFENEIKSQNIDVEAAIDQTKTLFKAAVKSRTSEKLVNSSMLSSGLDSSSVTVMASRELKNHGQNLNAYCSVPLYPNNSITWNGRIADESYLAKKIAQTQSNINFYTVNSSDITPVQGIKMSLEATSQPFYATSNDHWINSIAKQSESDGNHTLLNGGMGNISFSYDARRAVSVFNDLSNLRIKLALAKLKWKEPFVSIRKKRHLSKTGHMPWKIYSPINNSFATRIDLISQMKATGHDPTFYTTNLHNNTIDERLAFISPRYGSGVLWNALARTHGLDVMDPTSDTQLLIFLLGLPDSVFTGPNNEGRWLGKQVSDFLPDEALNNDVRGLQAPDLLPKLRQDAQQIDELLYSFTQNPYICDLIDMDTILLIWEQIKSTKQFDRALHTAAYGILLNAIATGQFIAKYT